MRFFVSQNRDSVRIGEVGSEKGGAGDLIRGNIAEDDCVGPAGVTV